MKIAIEAQRIFRKDKHGMDFVILEELRKIRDLDHKNEYFVFVAPGNDVCLDESENMHVNVLKCPTYPLWEQIALPVAVKKTGADILHCTSNTAPLKCPVPLLLTLHDVIFMEKKHSGSSSLYQKLGWRYRRMVVPYVAAHSACVITVSEYEKKRIKKYLDLPEDRVKVIYNGYGEHFRPVSDYYKVTSMYLPDKKYIFFLGNRDPKKNTEGTLRAYASYLGRSSRRYPLLIADLDKNYVSYLLRVNSIGWIMPYLRFAGYIPNKDLPYLYCGASAYLYTSLRESFGIPLLESMACGTPVITSRTSAMPEIAGEGAVLADPDDPADIASCLIRLEVDEAYRKNISEYGLRRVAEFSWKTSAEKLLEVYEDTAYSVGIH
ncbi:MAG: glycosyltransferase family 4 protein [Bacteroidales bacterium]|nr:glycosyltransferase family 4 protein [Bacteroidales bacterium]